MKINLVQAIKPKASGGVKFIQKWYESDIKPTVGDEITDESFWAHPYEYKIVSVMISYSDNSCRIVVDDFIVPDAKKMVEMQKIAIRDHGWKEGGALLG